MCKAVEEYAKSVAQSATAEVSKKLEAANKKAEAAQKKADDTIKNLLNAGKLSIEEIADAVSEPVEKIRAMAEEMNAKKV